jgi:hypothetical protein
MGRAWLKLSQIGERFASACDSLGFLIGVILLGETASLGQWVVSGFLGFGF